MTRLKFFLDGIHLSDLKKNIYFFVAVGNLWENMYVFPKSWFFRKVGYHSFD